MTFERGPTGPLWSSPHQQVRRDWGQVTWRAGRPWTQESDGHVVVSLVQEWGPPELYKRPMCYGVCGPTREGAWGWAPHHTSSVKGNRPHFASYVRLSYTSLSSQSEKIRGFGFCVMEKKEVVLHICKRASQRRMKGRAVWPMARPSPLFFDFFFYSI